MIAGYHWFTDWGRDTMISLEGLTLVTGRADEARYILRTFAHYIRDGLHPQHVPRGKNAGLYHTADATLWFFHAVDRYLALTGDRDSLRDSVARAARHRRRIIARHPLRHRRRPARRPPAPGEEGYQLTWMDAKVRRLGGHAAAGQSGRDQRALVQRASPAGGAGKSEACGEPTRAAELRASRRRRLESVQRALLERARAAICTTSSTASRRRRPRLPAQPGLGHLAPPSGAGPRALAGRGESRPASFC